LGTKSGWSKAFAGIGMAGLIASFHAIIISYSRQIFALSRGKFLPAFLSKIGKRQTPYWALIAGGVFGVISILTGSTQYLIVLSVLGAVVMYIISMASVIKLRTSHPNLKRSYKTPLYPALPIIAIVLSVLCLVAIVVYNQALSMWFGGIIGLLLIGFYMKKEHKRTDHEHFHVEEVVPVMKQEVA
jgi:ethanolamine permease